MSSDPHVDRCASAIRALSDALVSELRALSPEAWDQPTNCAPWRVRDLAAHVVSSGEGFVANIRGGLAGSVAPRTTNAERQTELEAADADAMAHALQAVTDDFVGLYAGLQEAELSTICYHRRGNRSVRWYAVHRLAEIAFHSWDLQVSLGRGPRLDERVAALLLPTLLESNVPLTYAAGLSAERGSGERYALAVAGDRPTRWQVTIDPDKLETQPGGGPADTTITGSAATLALLVYGRSDLLQLVHSGSVQVDGDPALVERFAVVFPRP